MGSVVSSRSGSRRSPADKRILVYLEITKTVEKRILLIAAVRHTMPKSYNTAKAVITIVIRLRYDYDTTTIRLQRIARACFHSTRFDASKKLTCQFFVVVMS